MHPDCGRVLLALVCRELPAENHIYRRMKVVTDPLFAETLGTYLSVSPGKVVDGLGLLI